MEPYRPYVDQLVIDMMKKYDDISELNVDLKAELLQIPAIDVVIDGKRNPLMIGVGITTASLYKCFKGEIRKIQYPEL